MRVDKKFAPITITIENEDEKKFLIDLINSVLHEYNSRYFNFINRSSRSSFIQKCEYFKDMIK